MALSTKTAKEAWDRVQEDLGLNANSPAHAFRISDQNEAIRMIVGLFYDLMASFYESSTTLVPSTTGARLVSGGSWTASTNRLTATMNRDFAASDVGNFIAFTDDSNEYGGVVSAFVSTTVVELSGDNLPTSNLATLTQIILLATSPTSDVASLSSIDMMRSGQQIRMKLFSSLTTSTSAIRTKPATVEEIKVFRASANQNKNVIIFALSGNNLYLAKGSSLSSYGTLTLFYPGMPINVTDDDSEWDIPDGTPYELAIMQWEKILRRRLGMPEPDLTKEIQTHIQNMYATFGGELSAEVQKEKAAKLK